MNSSGQTFKLYVPIFTVTLILSAFLLFGVQPLFSKMILPRLGGSASVWNTAMVFFQAVLLCGYLYAHITSKYLHIRLQIFLHLILFGIFAMILPLSIPDGWNYPEQGQSITLWQLSLMGVAVGGPFFILSGCAPLMQKWFAKTDHPDASNPYFLYAASNFGSMAALLTYPIITEPLLTLPQQTLSWSYGYGLLALMIAVCAMIVWNKNAGSNEIAPSKVSNDDESATAVTNKQRGTWLLLAFVPSSLMLGVTSFITTDIASAPLLWVVPLALYVSTFIFAFARKQFLNIDQISLIQGFGLIAIIGILIFAPQALKLQLLLVHLFVFFFTALLFHTKLVQTSPHADHLTEFYVFMSLGGVLGGMFNALLAPVIFPYPIEYILVLAASCLLRFYNSDKDEPSIENKEQLGQQKKKNIINLAICFVMIMACFVLALFKSHIISPDQDAQTIRAIVIVSLLISGLVLLYCMTLLLKARKEFATVVLICVLLFPAFRMKYFYNAEHLSRNYFGVSIVTMDERANIKKYFHGTTVHGVQSQDPDFSRTPLAYYYVSGNEVFHILNQRLENDKTPALQNVAIVGLGVGTLACYDHPLRHFDLYEIDQDVVDIALNPDLFTYLSDCKSPYEIFVGDGRIEIEKQNSEKYDLIYLDAFSSDNVPVHIITKEAFDIYASKLNDDGAIIINISNRYLNMIPVIHANAKALGAHVRIRKNTAGYIRGSSEIKYYSAVHAIITKSERFLSELEALNSWEEPAPQEITRIWTDDYANILSAILSKQDQKAEKKRQKKANQ